METRKYYCVIVLRNNDRGWAARAEKSLRRGRVVVAQDRLEPRRPNHFATRSGHSSRTNEHRRRQTIDIYDENKLVTVQ